MGEAKRTLIDEPNLERLLGLESSKIGFYSEVKQKIQELEAANLGLRIKTNELQAVFDAISDSVVIYDHNGCIQHRNHVCPRLFPTETLVGRSCRALFHPESDHSPQQCPVEQALAGKSMQISFTTTKGIGESRYFDVTATPIEDPNEQTRALVFIRDVTEKRLNELQLVQAEKMSSIGMLAAGVAHEINNPLTSVAGYAEALLRRFRDETGLVEDNRLKDFKKYLEVIIRESYRCKGIIDSLLSFSRKSEGSVGFVDLNKILNEVLELVRHKARNEKIEIQESMQPDLPMIKGDEAGLRQVFMNLTMNALQAIDGPGMIKIATFDQNGVVTATICDSGCGIPSSLMDQIWDPFFTTKDVGQGLGLGLAVTYNIIKKHGGEIHVESKHGEGSKFTVRLPACQQ
ncbi:two-component system sensor histidine kinase NtrB [Geotalea uraniireducens]|uniref:histidine kinase n=1 Tax=Geotalea uraniireducens (strain Rf4) TaxID=351605 RepID=A5G7F9_GEOUR|nr:ATP-binding protein [Geotalea uraniireducens]ABQ27727.1 PAS/PAC sensor signal transduction histidine kinase [Geotalea uraniireducens Rf4]